MKPLKYLVSQISSNVVLASVILVGALIQSDGIVHADAPNVLVNAHAHNDYLHKRPLLDALDHGFGSVEADVFLIDGQLLVAHSILELNRERTLDDLYLKPLAARCEQNGGRVYGDGPELLLLIDLKSEAESTYQALGKMLVPYTKLLTRLEDGKIIAGAIRVVVSGNRPVETMTKQTSRLAFLDGRTVDLTNNASVELVPLVSDQWSKHFKWQGRGTMPEVEQQKLAELVDQAHRRSFRIRFWGVPDNQATWQQLRDAKVDLINTDKLSELANFLNVQQ